MLLVLGAVASSSCEEPGLEVVVIVDTVLEPGVEFDRVEIDVSASGRMETRCVVIGRDEDGCTRVEAGSRQAGGGFPLALSVASASGRGQLVARADLSLGEETVACRAVSAALEPGEPRMLRVEVGRACGAPDCASAEVVASEPWIDMLPPALEPPARDRAARAPHRARGRGGGARLLDRRDAARVLLGRQPAVAARDARSHRALPPDPGGGSHGRRRHRRGRGPHVRGDERR
ncbi:MAG: hypothetical protein M5U28_06765 [Sandaracinaceae bacterium]|nr:hypothetical protein [Sandaracinaceae bacterium]